VCESKQFPQWLKRKAPDPEVMSEMQALLQKLSLNTVCKSARCPNQGECFEQKTATFLILGDTCTRNCGFCDIDHGHVNAPDSNEPENVAQAVQILGLQHAVITSVTRDDLPDGGASHFASTILAIKKLNPNTTVEVLIPDFKGSLDALRKVVQVSPEVIGHNLETVPRLYPLARPQADYNRSLNLIFSVKNMDKRTVTKSGLMLGLGEDKKEVIRALYDLFSMRCDILTIGQYLPPSPQHIPLARYVNPEEFFEFAHLARNIGFVSVASGPFVRSSYNAIKLFKQATGINMISPQVRQQGRMLINLIK